MYSGDSVASDLIMTMAPLGRSEVLMASFDSPAVRLCANEFALNSAIAKTIAKPRLFVYIDFPPFKFDPPWVVPSRLLAQFRYQAWYSLISLFWPRLSFERIHCVCNSLTLLP